jgi:hypothetical protein
MLTSSFNGLHIKSKFLVIFHGPPAESKILAVNHVYSLALLSSERQINTLGF